MFICYLIDDSQCIIYPSLHTTTHFLSLCLPSSAALRHSCSSCLRCSLSSSCFLNPSAASRARRSRPKRLSSSWVISLATLRRLGTCVSTKPAKLMAVLTGVGISGCNGVQKMSRDAAWGVRRCACLCVVNFVDARSFSRVCG